MTNHFKISKRLIKIGFVVFGLVLIYIVAIAIVYPQRFQKGEHYFTGLNGWEFGSIIILLFLYLSLHYLVPFRENLLFPIKNERAVKFKLIHAVVNHLFLFLSMFLFLWSTQFIESIVAVLRAEGHPQRPYWLWMKIYNGLYVGDHEGTIYLMWNFVGVPLLLSFIFLGASVWYVRIKSKCSEDGFNAWAYSFWINIFLASTGWMYIAWFTLTDGDAKMWKALARGQTWGYFAIGRWGVFLNSPSELFYMIICSCICTFLALFVLYKKTKL